MKREVVIEIRGGTLVGLYTNDNNIDVRVVDWDDVAAGGTSPSRLIPDAVDDMPAETARMVNCRLEPACLSRGPDSRSRNEIE